MSKDAALGHLSQVQRNEKCAALLARAARQASPREDHSDWVVTIEYYILCLYLKALGECRGRSFRRHVDLRNWAHEQEDVRGLMRSYRQTEEWSRDARYSGRQFSQDEVERFNEHFEAIREGILPLLWKEQIPPDRVYSAEPLPPEVVSPP